MNKNLKSTPADKSDNWLKVSLQEWTAQHRDLTIDAATKQKSIALVIGTDDDVLSIEHPLLESVDRIIIEFTDVMDGRGFSQAAMLRETFLFKGSIHATNVLVDNIPALRQVGFDSFVLDNGNTFHTNSQSR